METVSTILMKMHIQPQEMNEGRCQEGTEDWKDFGIIIEEKRRDKRERLKKVLKAQAKFETINW